MNGGDMAAGRLGRIRQAPDGLHRTDDDRLPIGAAGEPDRGDIVLPTAEQTIWKLRYLAVWSLAIRNPAISGSKARS